MNTRTSPVPEVRITATPITDPESGTTSVTVVVDAIVEIGTGGEVSCGMIVLDELSDILILKEAIDRFITSNHLDKIPH